MKKLLFFLIILLYSNLLHAVDTRPNLQFVTPSIVRVQWSADGKLHRNNTGVCIYTPQQVKVKVINKDRKVFFITSELIVEIDKKTKALTFRDRKNGNVLLEEDHVKPYETEPVVQQRIVYDDATAHQENTANGMVTVKNIIRIDTIGRSNRFRVNFRFSKHQALYGLGSQMEDYMNLLGKTVYLTQHNLKIMIPVLNSTKGYGLLFDAGSAMKFSSEADGQDRYKGTMEIEAAKELDYYFIKGKNMADVVGGYRFLTGKVSLMPRWLFGYTQSKERYVSSQDIISTLKEYRRRHVPIDMIVQDWNYWPEGWGYMKMNPKYYPDPKALADSVHALHAKLMISIWPNPQYCPEEVDFRKHGFMLEHSVYDAFNTDARRLYWKYANNEFFSKGFDAWWCDSSEPLDADWNHIPEPENGKPYSWNDHKRRWLLNQNLLSDALGAERSSLYSLYHSMGIYENQRATTLRKRVVNLTRSSYAGQQRYGTIVWNGDTHASWPSFRQQIPSGLNYMATGNPYWTVDVGSFFVKSDFRWFHKGEFPDGVKDDAYKEYYVRMFQWATFLPMLRSHGSDTPREIWRFGEPGTPYYDAILKMIRLRYSLIPYIYSMAAAQYRGNYTMARPLAFDFPEDSCVWDLKDEYMFGNFLVCPVTHPMKETDSRRIYLPEGAGWTDFWTEKHYRGGQWIEMNTQIDRLPLFVRDGSIIATTEPMEYAAEQKNKPVTIRVYPGADTDFTFYDDEGDNYDYEKGDFSTIRFSWNERHHKLTIGNRHGSFPGMLHHQTFILQIPSGKKVVHL